MRSLLCTLLLASCVSAQEVVLLPEYKGEPGMPIQIVPQKVVGGAPEWYLGTGLQQQDLTSLIEWPEELLKLTNGVPPKMRGVIVYGPEGTYTVWAWNGYQSKASKLAITKVTIGRGTPKPPTPPVPPEPTPDAAPIEATGLHVLIVENSAKRGSISSARLNQLWDPRLEKELNDHCVMDVDKLAGWKMVDVKDNISTWLPHWQKAFARSRTEDFWLIVSNPGKGGWEGPLPANLEATLAIVRKYE